MSFGRLGLCVVVMGVIAAAATSAALAERPTGPVTESCGTAWDGQPESTACAVLWWDSTTRQISAHCTVDYTYPGVATNVAWCELQQGKGRTFESVAEAVYPGLIDTSNANQTYTVSTEGLAPTTKDQNTYSVNFKFQPTDGFSSGAVVDLATPFAAVCEEGLGVESSELPEATIGMPYTAELAACNGVPPYKWKKIGKLPKGLKLSKTGVLSGTPSKKLAAGSYPMRLSGIS